MRREKQSDEPNNNILCIIFPDFPNGTVKSVEVFGVACGMGREGDVEVVAFAGPAAGFG